MRTRTDGGGTARRRAGRIAGAAARCAAVACVFLAALAPPARAALPWGLDRPIAPASFPLARWEIAGDPLVERRDVQPLLRWTSGDLVPPDEPAAAAARLAAHLRNAGWWAAGVRARVGPDTPSGRVVTLTITAGEPVRVGEVAVRGNQLLTREEILSRMDLRPGDRFHERTLRADIERILRVYSERGRPLAHVFPGRFREEESGRLGFSLRISEGPQARIETVRIFGNTGTDPTVVARIGGVRPGDRWDPRRVEAMAARLRRENLFTEVGEPRVVRGSRDALLGVEIAVAEGPSNSFFGVLGYNEIDGKGRVVGIVDLKMRNLLGTARGASLHFERQAERVQDIAFRYREPWLLGSPLSVEAGAAQSERGSAYSRTDLDGALTFPLRESVTGRVALERRDTSFEVAPGERESETSKGGSVGVSVEARDRRINPSRGWRADALVGYRETGNGVGRTRGETTAQVVIPVGRRWVLSEEAGFRGVWSGGGRGVPIYEQHYLGGTNTLRGYREEQFHGDRIWWARTEWRARLSRRSRAYLLADVGGYAFRTVTDGVADDTSDVLAGFGAGMALETRNSGIVRFEMAMGRGDAFADAKVHVGLEQEF